MIYAAVVVFKNDRSLVVDVESATGYIEAQAKAEQLANHGVWIRQVFYPASTIACVHLPEKNIDKP